MPATQFGDNSTVVGDPSPPLPTTKGHLDDGFHSSTSNGHAKGKAKLDEFITTADYMSTDRPFFVPIGKDGLIAALQKLDAQLIKVCTTSPKKMTNLNVTKMIRSVGEKQSSV